MDNSPVEYQSDISEKVSIHDDILYSWGIISDAQDIQYGRIDTRDWERQPNPERIIQNHSDRLMHFAMNG
jgi:hypothetical protein